jgi:hypothetical protein
VPDSSQKLHFHPDLDTGKENKCKVHHTSEDVTEETSSGLIWGTKGSKRNPTFTAWDKGKQARQQRDPNPFLSSDELSK